MTAVSSYLDPVAVERACWGDRVYLRPRERTAAVHRLTRGGMSAAQIAELIGVSSRTVQRCRSKPLVDVSAFG